jgi:hypothetical protein
MSWTFLLITELCIAAALGFSAESILYFREKKDRLHSHGGPWGIFDRRPPVRYLYFRALAFTSAFCVALGFADFVIVVLPYIHNGYSWLIELLGLRLAELLVSASVVGLGFVAFWFKGKKQLLYGSVEVFFAAIAAIVTTRQITPTTNWGATIASFIGSIYIVSRGLNNIKDAMDKRPNKRLVMPPGMEKPLT